MISEWIPLILIVWFLVSVFSVVFIYNATKKAEPEPEIENDYELIYSLIQKLRKEQRHGRQQIQESCRTSDAARQSEV